MSFSTENTRLCRYDGCWREIVTDAPSMLIGHGIPENRGLLCAWHERQLSNDLQWLERNLPDLTEYRINRAYGHKNGGGGNAGTAPAPVRETLHDLLYADDDHGYPGLQGTLYEWVRSLKLNLRESAPLADMVYRIANHPKLDEHPSTPVYAEPVHGLVRKLRRFLTDDDGETVLYGSCPANGCLGQLSGYVDAETAKCPKCGFSMPVALIRAERVKRLLQSEAVRTRGELLDIIKACGMRVNRSTLRSWIHRGQLPQQGEDAYSNPLYRFSDFYRLASGLSEDADVWEIMQVSQNQSKEGDNK